MRKIGIVGVGKLGLCFALNAERKGFEVHVFEKNENYVSQLKNKSFQSNEPLVEAYLAQSQHLYFKNSIAEIINEGIDLIFIFVATPSLSNGGYDHSQIDLVADELLNLGKQKNSIHIIIGATVMPGYCTTLQEKLNAYNYTINYNPEFIAQGSIIENQQFPDQVLIGEANKNAGDKIVSVMEKIVENKPTFFRMDTLSAEIAKIATNCFLTTKISFANSIGDLAIKTGADKDKILEAIGADSRIGNKYLNYGFGFGGPCFPRDNRAIGKFAEDNGYELLISKATDEVNQKHLEFQFENTLNKYKEDETIVIEGVAYKKDSVFIEESQQLLLAVKLAAAGRKVLIKDNATVIKQVKELYPNLFDYKEVASN